MSITQAFLNGERGGHDVERTLKGLFTEVRMGK